MSDPSTAKSPADSVGGRGEFALIEAITGRLPQGAEVSVPPGDDAAVVLVDRTPIVVTTDVLVAGVHFRTDWSGADDIGRRAAAASLADLVAMGADPVALVVALTAPRSTDAAWVLRIADGLRDEAALTGASVVGGDLSSGETVSVAVTGIGGLGGRAPVLRSGAIAGDQVAVAGRLGWAEAGLAVLTRGFRSPRALVEAYRRPEVPYEAALAAATSGVHAMCDVSDGLVADLGHVAASSDVQIDIESALVAIGEPVAAVAAAYGSDPLPWVLAGGHDHALVGAFAADAVLPDGFSRIGSVKERPRSSTGDRGEPLVTVDGELWSGPAGHRHFAG
ncbi:MAG: thiamine-phosphate kinase [Actinomycetia bacterium]|nr:thiamine-phosphate kinase [Actinomycetes bacterium]